NSNAKKPRSAKPRPSSRNARNSSRAARPPSSPRCRPSRKKKPSWSNARKNCSCAPSACRNARPSSTPPSPRRSTPRKTPRRPRATNSTNNPRGTRPSERRQSCRRCTAPGGRIATALQIKARPSSAIPERFKWNHGRREKSPTKRLRRSATDVPVQRKRGALSVPRRPVPERPRRYLNRSKSRRGRRRFLRLGLLLRGELGRDLLHPRHRRHDARHHHRHRALLQLGLLLDHRPPRAGPVKIRHAANLLAGENIRVDRRHILAQLLRFQPLPHLVHDAQLQGDQRVAILPRTVRDQLLEHRLHRLLLL